MKKWLLVSFLCSAFVLPSAACSEDSALPAGVPADFPFPDGADLQVATTPLTGRESTAVSFSYSGDTDELYTRFRDYVTGNGYEISMENEADRTFVSMKSPLETCKVSISEGGSVTIATVTFTTPSE